jgi:uncharacterized protein (TIGR02246 family)
MAEDQIRALHHELIDAWNRGDAPAMAVLFASDGNVVGFDGSTMDGRETIESTLSGIFADHQTASYVAKVREVRFLSADVALLRAAVGMIPPGQRDINPDVNAMQSLVAVRNGDEWAVALFHNTPAAFHGRPDEAEALTDELRRLIQ